MQANNPWLIATSMTFLWPATLFAFQGQWTLYYSNLAVVVASGIYHSTKLTPLYYIDMVAANSLAILHSIHAIQLGVPWIPVPGILYSILMFCVGYRYRQFVWARSFALATFWHMTMHAAVLSCAVLLANVEPSSTSDYNGSYALQGSTPPSCSLIPWNNRWSHDDPWPSAFSGPS